MSIHDQRIKQALDLIERAQGLMLDAAEALSPVDGMISEWTATRNLHAAIKAHWHQVDGRRRTMAQR